MVRASSSHGWRRTAVPRYATSPRPVRARPTPIAIESTAANARRNRLSRRVTVRVGSLPSHEPAFDVVLANLIAGVLVALSDGLAAELRPGGTLIASGIFVDREADVVRAFEAAGLTIAARTVEGEWIALEARRPA